MHYRQASEADLDSIMALLDSAKDAMRRDGIDQWDDVYPAREHIAADIRTGTLFLAREYGRPAAIFVLSREWDAAYEAASWQGDTSRCLVLHRLCVDPSLQGRGIGRAALRQAEIIAAAMGCASVRLDVFTRNPHAVRLYERAGYRRSGTADWRKGRFLLMEKAIG